MAIKASRPRWVEHRWDRGTVWHRERELVGLRSSYSAYPHAMVDASIARLIARFNNAGIATTYCCSGLNADHRERGGQRRAYIMFAQPLPIGLTDLLPAAVYVDDGGHSIRFHNKTSDAVIRLAWVRVERALDRALKVIPA